jgi:hypothetical protein
VEGAASEPGLARAWHGGAISRTGDNNLNPAGFKLKGRTASETGPRGRRRGLRFKFDCGGASGRSPSHSGHHHGGVESRT